MLLAAWVVSPLAVEGALNESFCELLEEAVLAEQVFRLPAVFEQLVGSGRIGGTISFSFTEMER